MGKITKNQRQLFKKIASGDHSCLTQLYERYGAMLYGMLYRQLGDEVKAERILITTFLTALSYKTALSIDSNLFNHLFKIAQKLSQQHSSPENENLFPKMDTFSILLNQKPVGSETDNAQQIRGENLRKELKKFRTL